MDNAYRTNQESEKLPVEVPSPLVEVNHAGNQEGEAMADSTHSMDKKLGSQDGYGADLEAGEQVTQQEPEQQSKLAAKVAAFRRSRTWTVLRDMFWILLLVSRRAHMVAVFWPSHFDALRCIALPSLCTIDR